MDLVYWGMLLVLATIAGVIWARRKSVTNISLDIKDLKAGIELKPEVAEAILEEGEETPLLKPAQAPEPIPDAFAGWVVQVGGVNSRLFTRTAWALDEGQAHLDANRLVSVSFNRGGDIMWVGGPKGYLIDSYQSSTGNRTFEGASELCGIQLEDKLKNELSVRFRRKDVRAVAPE